MPTGLRMVVTLEKRRRERNGAGHTAGRKPHFQLGTGFTGVYSIPLKWSAGQV